MEEDYPSVDDLVETAENLIRLSIAQTLADIGMRTLEAKQGSNVYDITMLARYQEALWKVCSQLLWAMPELLTAFPNAMEIVTRALSESPESISAKRILLERDLCKN